MNTESHLLSRIEVRNFKSINHAVIDLKQLTMLVGENSAGKSSLLQALFLLAQISKGRMRPDVVSLNGMELNLGNFSDVLHEFSPGEPIELTLTVPVGSSIRRRRFRNARQVRHDSPRVVESEEASWKLRLGKPRDGLGIARIEGIEIHDASNGIELTVWPNDDPKEVEALYSRSRRLGLLRGLPAARTRLVSEVARTTQFRGSISVRDDGEGLGESDEVFPSVAVQNGFPWELYSVTNESQALARAWLDLKIRQSEDVRGMRPSRQLNIRRHFGHSDEVPEELVHDLFPEFVRWVNLVDRTEDQELPLDEASPLDRNRLEEVLGLDVELATQLGELLQSSRSERGVMEPKDSVAIDIGKGLAILLGTAVHYLGPLREDPSPAYRPGQGGGVAKLGLKGEFTVAALDTFQNQETICPLANGESDTRPLGEAVDYWASKFGLASGVRTKDMGRPGIELELLDPQTGRERDLTSVGVGVSQLLPVIVLCLLAQSGELILLEQPELHLHPAPQQILGDFLLGIAESGRQVIVETHSEYLINRLRLRIADDTFGPVQDLVQIWYARRNDGQTQFDRMTTNRFGSFEEWPAGFFDQAPREAEEILRAVARKRRAAPVDEISPPEPTPSAATASISGPTTETETKSGIAAHDANSRPAIGASDSLPLELSAEVRRWLNSHWPKGEPRKAVETFIAKVVNDLGAFLEVGKSPRTRDGFSNKILVRRTGHGGRGGFVYIMHGGNLLYRLPPGEGEWGYEAPARNYGTTGKYRAIMPLQTVGDVGQATGLAQYAYDALLDY